MAGLPRLEPLPARHMGGPTPYSNYVIPGRVIAGAFPASQNDDETELILTRLLELGVTTFVCLQAEVNVHIPEHAWRAGLGLRPYVRDAQRILTAAASGGPAAPTLSQRSIDFVHLPILDGSVTDDSAMSRLADNCCERVLRGEQLYIHCWGGHGRTGTLVAVMLGRLYGLPYSLALRHTQAYHDARVYPQGVRSPQTPVQRAQVKRLLLAPLRAVASVTPLHAHRAPGVPAARLYSGNACAGDSPTPAGRLLSRSKTAVPSQSPSPVKRLTRSNSSSRGAPTESISHALVPPRTSLPAAGLLSGMLPKGWLSSGACKQRGLVRSGSARGSVTGSVTGSTTSNRTGSHPRSGSQQQPGSIFNGHDLQQSLRQSAFGSSGMLRTSSALGGRSTSGSAGNTQQ